MFPPVRDINTPSRSSHICVFRGDSTLPLSLTRRSSLPHPPQQHLEPAVCVCLALLLSPSPLPAGNTHAPNLSPQGHILRTTTVARYIATLVVVSAWRAQALGRMRAYMFAKRKRQRVYTRARGIVASHIFAAVAWSVPSRPPCEICLCLSPLTRISVRDSKRKKTPLVPGGREKFRIPPVDELH